MRENEAKQENKEAGKSGSKRRWKNDDVKIVMSQRREEEKEKWKVRK